MPISERQWPEVILQMVDDFRRRRLTRRGFLQHAMALGFSGSVVSALLSACAETASTPDQTPAPPAAIDVLNVWGGEERDSFRAVIEPFTSSTQLVVNIESTRDLDAALTTRIRGNNPPDLAILPNPGKMQQLASQNKLVRLDSFLDMNKIRADYASTWVDLGSFNGGFYALFYKAASKGTVWYSPTQFQLNRFQTPSTWSDLINLSDTIARSARYPWSMGVESGAASGWPATDWIAEIYLNQSGPDMYDRWVSHEIPWTDVSIKNAFQMFGQIIGGDHYINGAPQSILATSYQLASYAPFTTPPQAYMYYLGDFTAGFITTEFPAARAGIDFNFFPFPTINTQYQEAVTGGADVVVALKDTSAVRQLISYLATADAQTIWVKRGGFTSVNKSVDLAAYPNAVARASARMLTNAKTFRFGAGDLMPPAVQNAFWKGALNFIADQRQLGNILNTIEFVAQQAYSA